MARTIGLNKDDGSEMHMATEFGQRRVEILAFLKALSAREKVVVLSFLSNDATICARLPNLASAIQDMHRSYHKLELLQLAGTESSNLSLEFLARRKRCRLERVGPHGDCWRILRTDHRPIRVGLELTTFTQMQALDVLRSLPDETSPIRNNVPIER
jgi:hypothetical protein